MQTVYLTLALVGFCVPAPFGWLYTLENPDNIFFITNPAKTVEHTFANHASAAFTVDLVWVFVVFCVWVLYDSRRCGIRYGWGFVPLAFLFGLSGPFPLYLYARARHGAGAQCAV
jgi:hypothetical protein